MYGNPTPERLREWRMMDHLSYKIIEESVDQLVYKLRSQSPQLELAATMFRIFFEGPEGEIKRKELESNMRDELGPIGLPGEFGEALEKYNKKAEELALWFVMEDAKKMLEACFGVQAEK
ncbi:hypothetical protein D6D15_01485 [Aureobasidium pullulans]|uniref:Uncharacterized protein n=1 Tax=Aureobasidium pullulans TaxID=5580 RepID=A0A4V4IWY9_AURPU|nr:hypothetical protein D6D15_01485 [Aureobasidium pullulans]